MANFEIKQHILRDSKNRVLGILKYKENNVGTEAYVISRKQLKLFRKTENIECLPSELKVTDQIYFLVGTDWNIGKTSIYVGMTDSQPFYKRLIQHEQDRLSDVWDTAIVFSNRSTWDGTRVRYLESVFFNLLRIYSAKDDFRYTVKNVAQTDSIYWEQYKENRYARELDIESIMTILKTCGYDAFDSYFDDKLQNKNEIAKNRKQAKEIVDRANFYKKIPHVRTPDTVVKQMIENLFNRIKIKYSNLSAEEYLKKLSNLKFLDISCKKDCEFLEEIYDILMKDLESLIPSRMERSLHILNNQLFGMVLSPGVLPDAQCKIGRHCVESEDNAQEFESNAQWMNNYLVQLRLSAKDKEVRRKTDFYENLVGENGVFKNMKFDVIVGNPPYGESHNYIYCDFMYNCTSKYGLNAEFVTMITPQRYLIVNNVQFREIRDLWYKGNIVNIVDFPNQKDVFNDVMIAGGVSYFLFDRDYSGDTDVTVIKDREVVDTGTYSLNSLQKFNVIARQAISNQIYHKVINKDNIEGFQDPKDIVGALQSRVRMNAYGILRTPKSSILANDTYSIPCLTTNKDIDVQYVSAEDINNFARNNINKYKVHITYEGPLQTRIVGACILRPGQVQTLSWTLVDVFDSLKEAENLMRYLNTRFVRYIVDSCTSQLNITQDNFRFVPIQNWTDNSDIDWSKSVQEIDEYLYKKYNLSDDEIAKIKTAIPKYYVKNSYFVGE